MVWSLDKIDFNLHRLSYNPSMITLIFYQDELDIFLKFISEINLNETEINIPVISDEWYFKIGLLDNGEKVVELYSSNKGVAFVIFYIYFEQLIELCKKRKEDVAVTK